MKVEQNEQDCLIRLEGQVTLAAAEELKTLLIQWLPAGKKLVVDLKEVDEIDITVMQLLWAAAQEAAKTGASIDCRASDAVAVAMRSAGFEQVFPFEE